MPTSERWERKASALRAAWERRFGDTPPLHAAIGALSVAEFETHCGDSWPGQDGVIGTQDDENNWGATTLRALNAAELKELADRGIRPIITKGHETVARVAMHALRDAGFPLPQGVIHCDSRPTPQGQVPYFVWFASFPSETEGAEYFLKLLCGSTEKPKRALGVLRSGGSSRELAAAMYGASYFMGFHPHGKYLCKSTPEKPCKQKHTEPTEHDGNAENIDAYAGGLRATAARALAGLTDDETPAVNPAPNKPVKKRSVEECTLEWQTRLKERGHDPGKLDGDFGEKSLAASMALMARVPI